MFVSQHTVYFFSHNSRLRATLLCRPVMSEGRVCEQCGDPAKLKCSACRAAWYCSPICQKAAWKAGHKFKCHPAEPSQPESDSNRSRGGGGAAAPAPEPAPAPAPTHAQHTAREDCPLCLEPLPALSWRGSETFRLLCCGKELCAACNRDFMQGKAIALSGQIKEHTDFVRRLRAAGATGAQLRAQVAMADSLVRDVARTQKCPMCRAALPTDDVSSFTLLRRHAEDGRAWAQNNVAHRYETGRGVAKDGAAACHWFRAAAVQGHQMAQAALAQAYAYGQFGLRADAAEALRWYTAAAEQGNAKAMWAMGVMHRDGVTGLPRDQRLARTWLQKSAELGCAEGQADLGCMYEDAGRLDLALQWTARAAEKGNAVSQNNVGAQLMQMAQARHGSVDVPGHSPLPLALRWLRKAAAQGEAEAVALLSSIEQQLKAACSHCQKPAQGVLFACGRCKAAFYCSQKCQRAHWKAGHKRDCGLDIASFLSPGNTAPVSQVPPSATVTAPTTAAAAPSPSVATSTASSTVSTRGASQPAAEAASASNDVASGSSATTAQRQAFPFGSAAAAAPTTAAAAAPSPPVAVSTASTRRAAPPTARANSSGDGDITSTDIQSGVPVAAIVVAALCVVLALLLAR